MAEGDRSGRPASGRSTVAGSPRASQSPPDAAARPSTLSRVIEVTPNNASEASDAAMASVLAGEAPLLLPAEAIAFLDAGVQRAALAAEAAGRLQRVRPDLSAHRAHATWQLVAVPAAFGLACSALAVVPETTLPILAALATLPFVAIVMLRLAALVVVLAAPRRKANNRGHGHAQRRIADAELPIYTILVPLFKEAEVVPDIVAAIGRLDYPADRLDVLLVLEEDDAATIAACNRTALSPCARTLVVPPIGPQTKPKALNYAMAFARGAFVVVYDAEDEPEPDQLRKAVAAFRHGPPGLVCVQAALNIYNAEDSLVARQFTLEYGALFDGLLPAMTALRLPIPLGGTSNHFPRKVLEELELWDAYNVTEDADLGMRIARRGGRVDMLPSTTFEEAPPRLGIWLPQRTRWLKGFMQTWLVHMRRPMRLLWELGGWRFLGFHIYLGGVVLSALLHPVFLAIVAVQVLMGSFPPATTSPASQLLTWLAILNLCMGYAAGIGLAVATAIRRGHPGLAVHAALLPAYWLLISVAAWRAVLQLWRDPYLWEKTPHASRGRRSRHRHGGRQV